MIKQLVTTAVVFVLGASTVALGVSQEPQVGSASAATTVHANGPDKNCHVWAYAIWRDRNWEKATGSLHGCGGYIRVASEMWVRDFGAWRVASITQWKLGGAGVSNFTRARCNVAWGHRQDARAWREVAEAQVPGWYNGKRARFTISAQKDTTSYCVRRFG